jgi:ankyrin repeat protein
MPRIDLEQQRKRAKDLRRAHARGDADAARRISEHLPRARGRSLAQILAGSFTLSEAQLVVAREAGFASWPAMRHALAVAAPVTDDDLVDRAVRGELAGEALPPGATSRSVFLAAAVGDVDAVSAHVGSRPAAAHDRDERRRWTALLYACVSRHAGGDRAGVARRLLDAGADPDARGLEPGYTSANVSMLDVYDWRPLEGAARAGDLALVELLVARGASPGQTGALLTRAVQGGRADVVRVVLAHEPPWYQVIWALCAAVALDRVDLARVLVPAAARPSVLERALIDAIRLHRDAGFVEVLLGARPAPMWRDAYRAAVRHDHAGALALLRARGLDDSVVSAADRAIAACIAGAPAARPDRLDADDHRMLAWAIGAGRLDAVPRLLALGCDPNVADLAGDTPLHLAVRAGATPTIDALVAAGATIDARDYDARTPLDLARATSDRDTRDRLVRRLLDAGADPARLAQFTATTATDDELRAAGAVEREDPAALFERAADAVAFGELDALRELLDDEPALVHARSPRPHRATLLHYTAANGTEDPRQRTPPEAPAIAALLLARGADPDATCKMYRGGATTMALLLTSAVPRAAKLDGELVRVLAAGGATVTRRDLAGAILYDSPLAVAALVDAGVPVDDLLTAAGTNRADLVRRLLAAGADVDARFDGGVTALHAAAAMNQVDAARVLLEHGADATLRDDDWDNTPAGWARHFGHVALAELIEGQPTTETTVAASTGTTDSGSTTSTGDTSYGNSSSDWGGGDRGGGDRGGGGGES